MSVVGADGGGEGRVAGAGDGGIAGEAGRGLLTGSSQFLLEAKETRRRKGKSGGGEEKETHLFRDRAHRVGIGGREVSAADFLLVNLRRGTFRTRLVFTLDRLPLFVANRGLVSREERKGREGDKPVRASQVPPSRS